MTLTPAYGRDYKSQKEVLEAWNSNKDFTVADLFYLGTYCNKTDVENDKSIKSVTIRYSKLTKVMVIKVN